ncbi:MAG: ABC transporter substrate-binding protein [Burkholderiales bacterium]
MIDRRRFVLAAAGVAAGAARAQPAAGPRLGWISYTPPGEALAAFEDAARALGYTGRNALRVDVRVVEPTETAVRAAVQALESVPVAAIVTQAAASPLAIRVASGRVPMLFAFSGDPVIAGMVQSFARPGGNATGVSFMALELVGKRLEVMKQIEPAVRRVAILANPQHPGESAEKTASLVAAERQGVETVYVPIRPGEEPDAAFDRIRKERVQGLIVFQDAGMVARSAAIAAFAVQERLLAVSGWTQFVRAGFIASYGPSLDEGYRRLATFVDRVQKGARPADMAVELPTRIELAVNLKTAKALGITVPASVRARADEVVA